LFEVYNHYFWPAKNISRDFYHQANSDLTTPAKTTKHQELSDALKQSVESVPSPQNKKSCGLDEEALSGCD